ncbi:MAG: sodium:solute symporter, partial [Sciscionella sp.]|nr:sodium:solute symporter [Sciscionella sp.]
VTVSIVATETSNLTVISTPGLVFGGGFTFLQLALGYIIGRIVVAMVLLPRYFKGNQPTAYAYLGKRFGSALQSTASVTFIITRLLAEGVRLFAGAIPIQAIFAHYGINTQYWQIVVLLTFLTVIYAFVGGIKSVIWVDLIQWSLYILGAIGAVIWLATKVPSGWASSALHQGAFHFFEFGKSVLTYPYAFFAAIIGGAFLSMASHGADQLIVQRLLACKSLRDGQRAVIASGIVVFIQFALYSLIGAMVFILEGGSTGSTAKAITAGTTTSDTVFPNFIVNDLPVGLSGLLIAGILAATMGALASALNTMSTSTVADLYQRFTKRKPEDSAILRHGRVWTLVWAAVFAVFASLWTNTKTPTIQLGLAIAGYTYGALLGAFFLGIFVKRARQGEAIAAFLSSVVVMAFVLLFVKFDPTNGIHISFGLTSTKKLLTLGSYWNTLAGVIISLVVGGLLSLRHNGPAPEAAEAEQEQPIAA